MKICIVCQGEINDNGWGQHAYCTADGRQYIHHQCRPSAPPDTTADPFQQGFDPVITAQASPPSEYLTLPDAAQLLGVSPQTLRRRIKAGTLPAFRLAGGQTILLQRAALLKLLHRL